MSLFSGRGWAFWRTNLSTSTSGAGSRPTGLQVTRPLAYSQQSASPVNIDTAFQVSAVYAAVKLITEAIGSMPIRVYDVDAKGIRTRNTKHPLALLFNGKLNKWQTRIEFIETMTMQLALQGNAYALIQKNSQGTVIGLMPFMSADMQVALTAQNGDIVYRYKPNTDQQQEYTQEQILHVKCMGNGIVGLSPLGYARNSIGIAQAAEGSVTKIYSNGAKPSGVLTIDKVLKDDQRAAIKNNFAELEAGTQDRLFVLEAGMNYKQVSMTPADIELLASRRFQIEDIARFFGVPSVLINDTSATTVWGSGIQQIVEGWYKIGIRPYLERYQESFEQWLLPPGDRGSIEIEFDFDEFIAPSLADRLKTWGEATSKGLMTPNEARGFEGWAPLPGGDKAFMQQQMIPLDMLGTVSQPQPFAPFGKSEAEFKEMLEQKAPSVTNIVIPEVKIPAFPDIDFSKMKFPAPIINFSPNMKMDYEPPAITVTNEIAAPVVNVEAPNVTVEAPLVKFEAPNITVTPKIEVSLPARKTTTNVTYDKGDRIAQTTQIEEDA